jgi:hypothetical protein
MRAAIFVYQSTLLDIKTNESNLQLCEMRVGETPLSPGSNTRSVEPGIYKVVSCQDVQIRGDDSAFDLVVTPDSKTNIPILPARLIAASFSPVDASALQAFLVIPEAKDLASA